MKKFVVLLGFGISAALLATSSLSFAGPRTRGAGERTNSCSGPNAPAMCDRGPTFQPIGFIAEDTPQSSSVWDTNPEGTVFLVGPVFSSYIVKWTPEGGWGEHIGAASGVHLSPGGVIMGNGAVGGGFLWPGTWAGVKDEWTFLPPAPDSLACGLSVMSLSDMGGEGDYAAGLTWAVCSAPRAFKWDKATDTTVVLPTLKGENDRANTISEDGKIIYGFHTMLFGTRRATLWEDDGVEALGDPDAREPKLCIGTDKPCNANVGDPKYGCPDQYVDDASCQSIGSCTDGVCLGGYNAGSSCTTWKDCSGTCSGGPDDGARCNFHTDCSDTLVCDWNPLWTDDLFKGEPFDATPDGMYAVGIGFDFREKRASGYRYRRATGTFDEMPALEYLHGRVYPFRVSDDGRTAVGAVGEFATGRIAMLWREGLGTIDLQYFLVSQGLDDLLDWYLVQANAVSADGTIIGGYGWNPDDLMEGWIIDISTVSVCHAPPGRPEYARTVGVDIDRAADHLRHGDFLGTCEFLESNGQSRAQAMLARRGRRAAELSSIEPSDVFGVESRVPMPKLGTGVER